MPKLRFLGDSNKQMKLLLTGGMGFIGSHIVENILKNTDWEIIILERLDISGNPNRLTDIDIWEQEKHRVKFIWWDLKSELNDSIIKEIEDVRYIWHLAASSHVDRSIEDPMSFVMDNVVGTCNLLNFARKIQHNIEQIIYFGTDEVFGPAPKGTDYKEWDRYRSSNPYAATKAGAEELCMAFENTYKLPIVITHSMNIIGERQHPEKFIPMTIKNILKGDKVIIHGDKTKTKSGSRKWIHARNVCEALLFLTENGKSGDKYNIVGEEMSNLEIAEFISETLDKPLNYEMVDFHSSRPGHDLRYSLDGSKLREMGFEYPKNLKDSLKKTILWYSNRQDWL
jgi:dTDP-glucose 4,6-dehydratase